MNLLTYLNITQDYTKDKVVSCGYTWLGRFVTGNSRNGKLIISRLNKAQHNGQF